jgi:CDP-6-deoxy-D-xylo-4-hexulose-3-dehydrase
MSSLGDIVLLDFPYANRAGSKVRPGIVIAISGEKSYGDLQVAYLTTEVDSYGFDPFATMISNADLAEGTLTRNSVVRLDKVITVDSGQCRKVARLDVAKLDEVLRKATRHRVANYAAHRFAPATFTSGVTAIPPAGKVIGVQELENMVEAALDGWLTTGRFNEQFERKLGKFLDLPQVLTVNSGSSANLAAVSALCSPLLGERALQPGDEVITVAAGFPTTVNPILVNGLIPVFVDVELGTYERRYCSDRCGDWATHPGDHAGAYLGQSLQS